VGVQGMLGQDANTFLKRVSRHFTIFLNQLGGVDLTVARDAKYGSIGLCFDCWLDGFIFFLDDKRMVKYSF
jgi:hypothetical protein